VNRTLLSSAVVLVTLRIAIVLACKCKQPPPPQQNFDNHPVVFVGRVIAGTFLGDSLSSSYGRNFTLKISDTLKGSVKDTVEIRTGIGGGDCGYDFVIGREYLVYARYSAEPNQSYLFTTICDYTKEYIPDGRQEVEALKAHGK
jgi:hypothetical protein